MAARSVPSIMRRVRRVLLAAFATLELGVIGLAPVADALDHARASATPVDRSRQPSGPDHDPLSCAVCQHVERSRSIAASHPDLVLTSPDRPLAAPREVRPLLVSVRIDRPHSRDPPIS